jgi:rhomboid protease GluP
MCPHCRAFITTDDKICPYCDAPVGPRAVDARSPRDLLGGMLPHARFTTSVILTINVGLYIATMLYSMKSGNEGAMMGLDGETLYIFGAKFRAAVLQDGEWWRLITAGFLHGGLMHIMMNSWVLFDLGATVEELFGTSRMIAIYFVSTITGFLASCFWSAGLSVGASAGIFGLIGAMIALGMQHRSAMGDAIRSMYMRWAIYMLLFGLLPFLRVDNAAHIGGGLGGFAVAWICGAPSLGPDWRERLWNYIMYICLALTAFAFLKMFLAFRGLTSGVMSL